MPYTVNLKPSAAKFITKLDKPTQKRIVKLLELLAETPRPQGVQKLKGEENLWRVRVGTYRVVYEIHDDHLLILVIAIGHRKDIYRK